MVVPQPKPLPTAQSMGTLTAAPLTLPPSTPWSWSYWGVCQMQKSPNEHPACFRGSSKRLPSFCLPNPSQACMSPLKTKGFLNQKRGWGFSAGLLGLSALGSASPKPLMNPRGNERQTLTSLEQRGETHTHTNKTPEQQETDTN